MRIANIPQWHTVQTNMTHQTTGKSVAQQNSKTSFDSLMSNIKDLQEVTRGTSPARSIEEASTQNARATSATRQTHSTTISTIEASQKPLNQHLVDILATDAQGNVHEEQLQHGIVHYLLEQEDPSTASRYMSIFDQCIGQGNPPCSAEDAVKTVLSALTEEGLISQKNAEEINGISFRAAQLDQNLTALYDNRGSTHDNTIAVMHSEAAGAKALEQLNAIISGKIEAPSRSLTATSNQISSSGHAFSTGAGFLWKPISESDGKLVILLPSSMTGNVRSAGIYSELPASSETLIEAGRFTGDRKNGGRAHFRFSRPGGAYPDGSFLIAHLTNGSTASFQIGDSSRRNT